MPQLRALGYDGPIVIKSANQSSAERAHYRASGANGAIDKALTGDAFARALAGILDGTAAWNSEMASDEETAELSEPPAVIGGVPCDPSHQTTLAHSLDSAALVDVTRVRELPPELLMRAYDPRDPSGLEELLQLLETRYHAGWGVNSHQFVGRAQMAGAIKLARLAQQAEVAPSAASFEVMWEALGATRRQLVGIGALPPDASEGAGGQGEDDVVTGSAATSVVNPDVEGLGAAAPLFVASIDDSPMMQQMHELLLFPTLNADAALSRSMGETRAEQEGFVSYALGRVDKQLQQLPLPHRQADVVLLDQHISLGNLPHLLGTGLVTQLRAAGFKGVAAIISGASQEEAAQLAAHPGVDVATTKSFNRDVFAAQLLDALARRRAEAAADLAADGGGDGGVAGDGGGVDGGNMLMDAPLVEAVGVLHEGVPVAAIRRILTLAFDPESPESLVGLLRQLEARFRSGQSLRKDVHRIIGVALSSGAAGFARRVERFKEAPSDVGLDVLWRTLVATRRELRGRELLSEELYDL